LSSKTLINLTFCSSFFFLMSFTREKGSSMLNFFSALGGQLGRLTAADHDGPQQRPQLFEIGCILAFQAESLLLRITVAGGVGIAVWKCGGVVPRLGCRVQRSGFPAAALG
jgi:hypothetical protein